MRSIAALALILWTLADAASRGWIAFPDLCRGVVPRTISVGIDVELTSMELSGGYRLTKADVPVENSCS